MTALTAAAVFGEIDFARLYVVRHPDDNKRHGANINAKLVGFIAENVQRIVVARDFSACDSLAREKHLDRVAFPCHCFPLSVLLVGPCPPVTVTGGRSRRV